MVAPRNPNANAYDISATVALRRLLRSGNTALPSDVLIPYNVCSVIRTIIYPYLASGFDIPLIIFRKGHYELDKNDALWVE